MSPVLRAAGIRRREQRELLLGDGRDASVHHGGVRHKVGVARAGHRERRELRGGTELIVVVGIPEADAADGLAGSAVVVAGERVVGQAGRDGRRGALLQAHGIRGDEVHGGVLLGIVVMKHLALGEIRRGDAGVAGVLRVEVGLGAAEVAIGVESVGQQVGVTLGQRGAADDEHAAPERGEDEAEEDIGASALLDELLRRKRRVWESWSASCGGIG